MDENLNIPQDLPNLPAPSPTSDAGLEAKERRTIIIIILIALLVLVLTVASFIFLMRAPADSVAQLRDVFIIFMGLLSLLIGFVLVILVIQLARLINLLQNELTPILESTNETISNLRGTTTFLSENLTEPVIRMNEYLAGISRLLVILGMTRGTKKR